MGEIEGLDTAEPLGRRMQRHAFDRLIMLSDGVFAIAITLAALDLRPPEPWDGAAASFWAAMALPIQSYVISFIVIGNYWVQHRRMLARLQRVDGVFSGLMLLLLGCVALIPAATQFLNRHALNPFSVRVYASVIIAIGVLQAAAWAYASLRRGLVSAELGAAARGGVLLGMVVAPVFFALVAWLGVPHTPGALAGMIGGLAAVLAGRRRLMRRLGV